MTIGRSIDTFLFYSCLIDHIITMLQNLSHYEKILSRSHSNYLAQINIEMTSASNETNDVLTKLTVSQVPLCSFHSSLYRLIQVCP